MNQKIDNKILKISVITTITIFIFLASLPVLNYFEVWIFPTILEIFKEIANLLYLVSGFLLIIGLLIAYHQLNLLKEQVSDQLINTQEQIKNAKEQLYLIKEDMSTRNHSLAVEKSIDYLHIFANDIIPKINKFTLEHANRVDLTINNWDPSSADYRLNIFDLPEGERLHVLTELDRRRRCNLVDILNIFEFFSAGIMNGLGKEDIVYEPISNTFINFISSEIVELSSQRYLGSPYTNTIKLYKLWKKRKIADNESTQIQELEKMLNAKKSSLDNLESTINPPSYIGG